MINDGTQWFSSIGDLSTLIQSSFSYLWDSINAKRGYPWENNPLVWAMEFELIEMDYETLDWR